MHIVGQEILVQLLNKLRAELFEKRPIAAAETLDLIEKVAGSKYRDSLLNVQIDVAIKRATDRWEPGMQIYA
ncbi:hypothetical protein [Actinoplanes sp. TFC3]|uniref:hypothetical protein n=1 Tax=Actinoplanes sp. TFC3 TaxID=1710355 RepID=UPI000829E968|nr:hypothetical protein [Actinoplanes sp. TFC3]